jgi:Protein of unknown function (DUF1682)
MEMQDIPFKVIIFALASVYLFNYFSGKKKNKIIAEQWYRVAKSGLEKKYSDLGDCLT